ncbi:type IIG restriction enzyme/methyltransferase [Elizabethkingia miricola]|nr:Eco57I restriction-modification methylase domain-containing protein [Elizabethkingia miricola]
MKTNKLEPQKALNPAYKKFKPLRADIDDFSLKLQDCINAINLVDSRNESEEHLKSPISKFLSSTFYSENEINTKEKIDLAIYLGNDATSDIGVLIEAKKPSNKFEFPTVKQLNKKGFQEMLLYYLRERVDYKNNNIKHLIITNGFEWFFFNASDFYNLFYKNSELIKEYKAFRDGLKDTTKNELFYNEIAKKYIEKVEDTLPFVHLDFRNKEVSKFKDKELLNIYKLFSDVHLLGKSFGNDSNQLNKVFYNELLHIIGLEEVKESGKKIIQRKKNKEGDYGPLLENTIFTLEDKDYLIKIKNIPNSEEKSFIVGLELCLTWINRILFLKLLESQLRSYNNDSPEYKFLNPGFIPSFDALNELFFSALAKPIKERHQRYAEKFEYIPYLNSSLFEKSELEDLTFDITALMDEKMEVFSSTVLKSSSGKKQTGKLNTLEYIFKFLDAYDFSADASVEINDKQQNKTLINASVLGLIFEKINGYKDGSFYTPGTITMFMCKETLRKSVTQKFKEEITDTIETFEDVIDYCNTFFKKEDRKKFNEVVNSIKICDPAVGSGHFLVSALNEMIVIKSELGILGDEDGKKLPCTIEIDNDEIYISDADGELFNYNRKDSQSLKIQKAIFHEKETIIENCLFGVDINPNSVNICRLRLWIELLKNAYYTDEGELQTLPNIDINIKCGNSLISKFALNDSLKTAFKSKEIRFSVEDYKQAVKDYKTTNSKTKKREIEDIISTIKNNLKSSLDNKEKEKVSKALGEYQNEEQRQNNLIAFGETIKKAEKDKLKRLKQKAEQAKKQKEEILNNVIYHHAFEWRFEFPEVLDNDGNFTGFDVIIGNPPYIRIQGLRDIDNAIAEAYVNFYNTATGSFDIYSLFVEKGLEIIKKEGIINYIMPVKWTNAAFGIGLRKLTLSSQSISKIINFGAFQAFEASTYTGLQWFENNSKVLNYYELDKDYSNITELGDFLYNIENEKYSVIPLENLSETPWILTNTKVLNIIEKLNKQPRRVSDVFDKIFQGLATSKDDVYFLYNCELNNDFIEGFSKEIGERIQIEKDFLKPLLKGDDVHRYENLSSDKYVIFPYKFSNNNVELYTETEIQKDFPFAYTYLKRCENTLRGREKGRLKSDNFWYRYIYPKNLTLFDQVKLVAPEISLGGNFSYDVNGHFYSTTTVYGYIKKKTISESYLTLLAFMNSKLLWWYLVNTGTVLTNGYFRFKPNYLFAFPIPEISFVINSEIEKLTNEIILLKNANNEKEFDVLNTKLNNIIYSLYNLDELEVQFINNSV